jgi:hypothetical protein
MTPNRQQRRLLEKDNAKWTLTLKPVPRSEWPDHPRPPKEVWRSRDYLVQVYAEGAEIERMSVSSTKLQGERWADGITWDELMSLKRQCGRGDRDALEVYPADKDVVNVANMRHLWLPPEPVAFAWRKK